MKVKGLDNVLRNLKKEVDKMEHKSNKGLMKAALLLQSESIDEVPVDEGNLHNSSYVEMENTLMGSKVYIGYNAVYAARVHENPRSGKTGGQSPSGKKYKTWAKIGKWKFLEDPFKRLYNRMIKIIAKESKA